MIERYYHTRFLGAFTDLEKAPLVLMGLPLDSTSSYIPGSRFAPERIRSASDSLETYSPYQNLDLRETDFFDLGNLDLPIGYTAEALKIIRQNAQEILAQGKKILALGGEHLVTLPLVEAYKERYPDLQVIQMDAHADLRDAYGGGKYSHATTMRRVVDVLGWDNVYQLGIRSGEAEEFALGRQAPHFHPFNLEALDKYLIEIGKKPVYLTLDIDVLDPSFLPGTGTPEPGGVDFLTLLKALLKLKNCYLVGADLTELNPQNDPTVSSIVTAAKLVRELLLLLHSSSESVKLS